MLIKGCDVIGLQETKSDGTSEISSSGCRFFFSGDCSGVKGRKGNIGLDWRERIISVKRLARAASQSTEFRLNQISLRSW